MWLTPTFMRHVQLYQTFWLRFNFSLRHIVNHVWKWFLANGTGRRSSKHMVLPPTSFYVIKISSYLLKGIEIILNDDTRWVPIGIWKKKTFKNVINHRKLVMMMCLVKYLYFLRALEAIKKFHNACRQPIQLHFFCSNIYIE